MQAQNIIQQLSEWMQNIALQYGYFGIFLISLIGSLAIIFPIPYTVIIFTLGGLQIGGAWAFEPVWVATVAGLGSALGEFSAYLLGVGGRRVLGERYRKKMVFLMKLFRKYGSIVIFVFALTPLPDDLLFIPLGVMRYSIVRAFIPALIGKFCMNLIVVYSGRFSVQIIKDIFGVQSDWIGTLIGIVIALILLIVVFVIMFKADWEKYFEKYLTEERKSDT